MQLINYIKKYKFLDILNKKIQIKFALYLKIGIELECYIVQNYDYTPQISYKELLEKIRKYFPFIIKTERGKDQFEIVLNPSSCISYYAEYIENLKIRFYNFCRNLGFIVLFDAKPFLNDFGSSMHVNISFNNFKENFKFISDILCSYSFKTKKLFFLKHQDYVRLDAKFMSPTHVCLGNAHNRTVLIRILHNRIEHRLASSNANAYNVFYAILISILQGLENRYEIKNFPIIYGNAFERKYHLSKI